MATEKFSNFLYGGLLSVGSQVVGINAGTTPTNTIWNFPGTGILDANGSPLLTWTAPSPGMAVNALDLASSTTGQPVAITAKGGDANVGLNITAKGSGNILLTPGTSGYVQIVGTSAAVFPSGTTGQRPVVGIGGMFRYNQTTNFVEYYNTGVADWVALLNDGAAVTSVSGVAGQTTSTGGATPAIGLANTTVIPGSYTYSSISVDAKGRITAALNGTPPVTSVSGAAGEISSSGGTTPVLGLINTAVTPGSYTYSSLTVDAKGRITAASNGAAPVASVTGTANQIDSTGGTTPVLSLSSTVVFPGTVTLNANPVSNMQAATKQYVDAVLPFVNLCQGRLTLTSNTPVTAGDVVGATTIYFTPYKGSALYLYNGTSWSFYNFTQLSIAVPAGVAGDVFDIFINDTGGSTLALSAVAWTNPGARATGITFQNGVYVKSAAPTYRYLGSFILTGSGTTEDSLLNRYLYNYYNRINKDLTVITASTWTYAIATFRQANASSANQVNFCIGVVEDTISASLSTVATQGAAGAIGIVAIGLNSTTAPISNSIYGGVTLSQAGAFYKVTAEAYTVPTLGFNYLTWLESSPAAKTVNYGDLDTSNGGLIANIWI